MADLFPDSERQELQVKGIEARVPVYALDFNSLAAPEAVAAGR